MRPFRIFLLTLLCFSLLSFGSLLSRSGGPGSLQMQQVSGAPGEGTCGNCHFGGLGGGSISIQSPSFNGGGYLPGQTYTMEVTIADPDAAIGGFQLIALDGNQQSVGSFITSSGLQTVSLGGKTYLEHNTPGYFDGSSGNNRGRWTFSWKAPGQGTGGVTFYASGVAADWLGNFDGDDVYVSSLSLTTLPVEFGEMEAEPLGYGRVRLRWSTLQEVNSDHFVVERSADGILFNPLGQIPAAGNSETTRWYEYTDAAPGNGISFYYRIKEVDPNGAFTLSAPVEVFIPKSPSAFLDLYPNPAILQESVRLRFHAAEAGSLQVGLRKLNGQLVFSRQHDLQPGMQEMRLPINELQSGHYFVETRWGDQTQLKKLVVAK